MGPTVAGVGWRGISGVLPEVGGPGAHPQCSARGDRSPAEHLRTGKGGLRAGVRTQQPAGLADRAAAGTARAGAERSVSLTSEREQGLLGQLASLYNVAATYKGIG